VPPAAEIQPNAASTNAVARMQPNPAATTTGVERSDEGDSFPAQYTKSALLAQARDIDSSELKLRFCWKFAVLKPRHMLTHIVHS